MAFGKCDQLIYNPNEIENLKMSTILNSTNIICYCTYNNKLNTNLDISIQLVIVPTYLTVIIWPFEEHATTEYHREHAIQRANRCMSPTGKRWTHCFQSVQQGTFFLLEIVFHGPIFLSVDESIFLLIPHSTFSATYPCIF